MLLPLWSLCAAWFCQRKHSYEGCLFTCLAHSMVFAFLVLVAHFSLVVACSGKDVVLGSSQLSSSPVLLPDSRAFVLVQFDYS
jgi:hypothetical protein